MILIEIINFDIKFHILFEKSVIILKKALMRLINPSTPPFYTPENNICQKNYDAFKF